MSFFLALKNVVSRKSSYAIILFIAFSISLLVVSNAFFDGTGEGIEKTFISSFTGDVVIRPKVSFPLSLLGDETPATGSFSTIPELVPYSKIKQIVDENSSVEIAASQLSNQIVVNCSGNYKPCVIFGIDPENYLQIMNGIKLKEGSVWQNDEKSCLISEGFLELIKESYGTEFKIGDTIQLLFGTGLSYSIRAVTVTGIYSYDIRNEVLDRIVLVSPEVLRELVGISGTSENDELIDESQNDLISDEMDCFSIDDLFGEDSDSDFVIESDFENNVASEIKVEPESVTSWNFIICKIKNGASVKRTIKKLNKEFKKNGIDVQAVAWRTAAGLSASYLFWIHNIFTIGIIILLAVGFIIINNTLIVSALDRIPETGTLRAIGAERSFIIKQFMFETLLLTVTAGVIGCFIGVLWVSLLNNLHITFTNIYLIQIFGGTELKTILSASNFVKCMILSVVLGFIGWIYPVKISMEVNPVQAMQRSM